MRGEAFSSRRAETPDTYVLRTALNAVIAEYKMTPRGLRFIAPPGPAKRAESECRQRALEAAQCRGIDALGTEPLLDLALRCLHALNRKAKHLRGLAWQYTDPTGECHVSAGRLTQTSIYAVKDAFLEALLRAGRARAETFTVTRASRRMYCDGCGREWVGDSRCYECQDDSGSPLLETQRWFIIESGTYRFHCRWLDDELAALATPCEPHDPDQPTREVPDVRLASEGEPLAEVVQMHAVRVATARIGVPAGERSAGAPRHESDEHDATPQVTRPMEVSK
jgi:hypothetical protein